MNTRTTRFVTALLAACASFGAQAYTLNFGTSPSEPLLACAGAGNVCSTYGRLLQNYGDVAGVVDVTTHAHDGGALTWWNTGYNELYGVAFNNVSSQATPAWVDLQPLQAGQAVTLTHFDLGGYFQSQRRDVAVNIYALGSTTPLFSYTGAIGTQGGASASATGTHSGFDLDISSFSGLRIQWADPAVAANTGIDNIVFSVGTPVPEPASGVLWLAGLGAVAWTARRRRGAVATAGLLGAALMGTAAQAATYTVTALPGLADPARAQYINGMNNLGQVVGRSDIGQDGQATLWAPGAAAQNLGTLPATPPRAAAYGINDAGMVVGQSTFGATQAHAFAWTAAGGMRDLGNGMPSWATSTAEGVNNLGQIVGAANPKTGYMEAMLWQADGSHFALPHQTLPGQNVAGSYGSAINDNGDVAGGTYYDGGNMRAVHWFTGAGWAGAIDLGDLAGGLDRSGAEAINQDGWVAGWGTPTDAADREHATLWNPAGEILDLQGGGFMRSLAQGVNSSRTVVGWGMNTSFATRAFVWTEATGMVDLNSLLQDAPNTVLLEADAINESGQIAALAYDIGTNVLYTALLSPVASAVPEPASWALMLAGALGVAARRRVIR